MKYFLFIFFVMSFSCNKRPQVLDKEYRRAVFQKKWEEGNSAYIKYHIIGLSDSTLTDCNFGDRVSKIAFTTGFIFCWIDCLDSIWLSKTQKEKLLDRKVIVKALEEYTNSCMFMKKKEWIICSDVDLYKYCRDELLTDPLVLDSLRKDMKKMCWDCSTFNQLFK